MSQPARPGDGVAAIDTPALVIDLDAMERNLARMAAFAREHRVCVQKTAEAEALVAGGVTDIYISNEVIAPAKLARVAALALRLQRDGGQLAIAVDSEHGVKALADAMHQAHGAHIDVFIDVDIGHGRCGVPPGEPALALARAIAPHRALRLVGLHAYHGSAQHQREATTRQATHARSAQMVRETRDLLIRHGFGPLLVTGAGTGTYALETASGLWGELQTGSYLFMDADYASNQHAHDTPPFEHALFVKAQVVSRQGDRAVCDAGHKSHAIDSGLPTVLVPPGLAFANGGDEHGVLRATTPDAALPALGDTVWLIPGHCDPTVNLHDWLVGVRGGLQQGFVERLIRVDARGALS